MTPRKYFQNFVKKAGGRPEAAKALGVPYPTLCSICNGYRGISRDMAERMGSASKGALDPSILIWVKATKSEKPRKKAAA